jgi:hypothetical protein
MSLKDSVFTKDDRFFIQMLVVLHIPPDRQRLIILLLSLIRVIGIPRSASGFQKSLGEAATGRPV